MPRNAKGYPSAQLGAVPSEITKNVLETLEGLRQLPRCKTDEEVEARIGLYFSYCKEHGMRPGVETLCLSLGVTRTTIWNWKNGLKCSERRKELANNALQLVSSYLETLSLTGAINPVTAVWLQKNWCGYRDNASLEIVANTGNNYISEEDITKIGQRYVSGNIGNADDGLLELPTE